ncbi:to.2 family protein [Megaselia abdita]
MKSSAILYLLVIGLVYAQTDSLEKCKSGDTKCIRHFINEVFNVEHQGVPFLKIPSIKPIKGPLLSIKADKNSPVAVNLDFYDFEVTFNRNITSSVKGFGNQINGTHRIRLRCEYITILADYKIDGKVLILPITGGGRSNLTFLDPEIIITIKSEPLEKDGKTYMKFTDFKLQMPKLSRMITNLENLFNGDKALGDNMNKFLNENWSDVFHELVHPVVTGLGETAREYISKTLENIPYNELFKD